jgi:subtilisin family serine protease
MFSITERKSTWALLAALFFGLAGSAAADFRPARGPKAEGEYIVVFKDEHPARDAAHGLAATHGGSAKRVWDSAVNGAHFVNLNEAAARALAKNPKVAWVQENGLVEPTAVQSSPVWGLDRIDQQVGTSGSYNYAFDGSGIHVYVLDTGLRDTHQEFGGRATRDFDARPDDGQNGNDCKGHGTHVAATIGGSTYGVAKNVRLHGVRVLSCVTGQSTWADVVEGINWVINNAQTPAIINMSLGGGADDATDVAVNNASNAGIFVVVSAGNDNLDACNASPARAAQAFTVAASTSGDNRASFSNWGACVELFAPGVGVLSASNGSDTATATMDGTSMAAPHVAGVAALLLDEDTNRTPAQLRDLLIARSTLNMIGYAGTNTPNRLLYSLTLGAGGLPQMPAYLDVQPWMCNGYNDVFWTNADGATYHQLQMSSSSSFTTPTLVYQGTGTDYLANVGGTRYFRVRSCGATGCSAWRYGDQAAVKANGCL